MLSDQQHLQEFVLIETLWNVKLRDRAVLLVYLLRINRNIVECKDLVDSSVLMILNIVLIETLWNVKVGRRTTPGRIGQVLIETLWNVKFIIL